MSHFSSVRHLLTISKIKTGTNSYISMLVTNLLHLLPLPHTCSSTHVHLRNLASLRSPWERALLPHLWPVPYSLPSSLSNPSACNIGALRATPWHRWASCSKANHSTITHHRRLLSEECLTSYNSQPSELMPTTAGEWFGNDFVRRILSMGYLFIYIGKALWMFKHSSLKFIQCMLPESTMRTTLTSFFPTTDPNKFLATRRETKILRGVLLHRAWGSKSFI